MSSGEAVTNRRTGETITFLGVHRDAQGEATRFRTLLAPRADGPPPHVHPYQVEVVTVVSGRVGVRVDGETRTCGPGETAVFPPGSVHALWNAGDRPAPLDGLLRPPLHFEAFMRELYPAMDATRGRLPLLLETLDVLGRYSEDLRLPGLPAWVQRRVFPPVATLARGIGVYRPRARDDAGGENPNNRS